MKILILLLALSFPAMACKNPIAFSAMEKSVNGDADAKYITCKDAPDEECMCLDGFDPGCSRLVSDADELGFFTGKHHLEVDDKKCSAKQLALQSAEKAVLDIVEARKNAKQELKSLDMSNVKTIADLKAIIQKLITALQTPQ